MRLDAFLSQRSPGWRRLTELLDRVSDVGPPKLTVAQVEELGRLYRRAASDLAYARAHFDDPETVSYLNQLVARGHSVLYVPQRAQWRKFLRFWTADFPRQVRHTLAFTLVAAFVLFGSVAVGAIAAMRSPEIAQVLVPPEFADVMHKPPPAPAPSSRFTSGEAAFLGSFILTNNIKVGFIAFALGVAFAAGTILVLLQNGLLLGALSGAMGHGKGALTYWSLIVPHGGIELLAVCLCAGAGLLLGWSLISPGDHSRREALIAAGRRAVPLVLGTLPLFGTAALIEAFVTPATISPWVKLAIGILAVAGAVLYLAGAGRHMGESEEERAWSR